MLVVEDLRVHYGRTAALQGISLEVNRGEIVGVVGPNGAGKSTLLWAICGVVRPTSGAISFERSTLLGDRPYRIVRKGVSLVPEGRRIFGALTVEENLRIGMTALSSRETAESDIARMLALFPNLQPYLGSPAGKLSGGEQQQLAIARALLARPRLLLLDEPSLGLAPIVTDRLFETLVALREAGTTLLLVEQNAARTVELADRTYVLRSGAIELSGTREELLHHREFKAAFLGFA